MTPDEQRAFHEGQQAASQKVSAVNPYDYEEQRVLYKAWLRGFNQHYRCSLYAQIGQV